MSEIDDFCETSIRVARVVYFFSLNVNFIFRLFIKDSIHRINWFEIFNLCTIRINRFVNTWLNVSFISRNKREKTFLAFFTVWISCTKYKDTSIADLFFLSLICSLCNKFEYSTKCNNLVAIYFSNIFLKQLNNIIILYTLDCE